MRERVKQLNGDFQIEGAPGYAAQGIGTTIRVVLPWDEDEKEGPK